MAEPPFGHESSAISVPRVVIAGLVTAVAIILVTVIVCLSLRERLERARGISHASATAIPPSPRLQAHPSTDLAALRTEKQAALGAWGWTDSARQFARIPIERAMIIYAAEPRPAAQAGPATQPRSGRGR
jgi:hypothetical protein